MKKFHFIFDKTKKAKVIKKFFSQKFKNFSPNFANVIIIAGGDGFMLHNLKKYYKFQKPFYGINCGTFGFLMNKYSYKGLEKKIINSKKITINPLKINSTDINQKKKVSIAINEISLFRQSKQTANLSLKIGKKIIIKKLIGDGVLVSTPAGSTAYNLSISGPILSLNSGKLAVTPISPFRPRRWKGKIVSNSTKIEINNLNPNKRPVAAVADNLEMRNIKSIVVKINKKIKLDLLYDSENSLVKRIKLEQKRKK
ncbi:NAD kinase [Candidatus Pelagibacter bacterium]|nr:NAD kinase [Candidatus Pelagibacter bacterium]MDA9624918.1 NAD kinase [Candidatus Pelagibacter bacterium]